LGVAKLNMSRLAVASSLLLLLSVFVYGLGLYLWETRSFACGDYFGLNVAIGGSGIAAVGGGVIVFQAYMGSSRKLLALALVSLMFAATMYFFVGVMTVACSGV
jgi:hypothetical protein